jgi:hypothetical protein
MVRKEYLMGIGAFLALLCLMVILYSVSQQQGALQLPSGSSNYTQQGSISYSTLSVQVTDPSFLPKGTSALIVTFSNASVYVNGGGWFKGAGYGPVNLEGQTNQSIVISSIRVPTNGTISASRLGIKSAYIVINGKEYAANVSERMIATNLTGIKIPSSRTLLVDFSPFALSTSSNVVKVGYSSRGYIVNGSSGYLGQTGQVSLATAKLATPSANITVKNATVSTVNGVTTITLTVVNHSNKVAHIGNVAVVGQENFVYNRSSISQLANSYVNQIMQKYQTAQTSGSGSVSGNLGGGLLGSFFNTSAAASTPQINQQLYQQALSAGTSLTTLIYNNVSALAKIAGPIPSTLFGGGSGAGVNATALRTTLYNNIFNGFLNASASQTATQDNVSSVAFSPGADGSMNQSYGSSGDYYIQPNSTETLTYTGQMNIDNGTQVNFVPDSSYDVVVAGSDGSFANSTVNADGNGG